MKLEGLEKLVALKNAGTITEAEYEIAKRKILIGEAAPARGADKPDGPKAILVLGGLLLFLVILGAAINSGGTSQQTAACDFYADQMELSADMMERNLPLEVMNQATSLSTRANAAEMRGDHAQACSYIRQAQQVIR